MNIFKKYFEKKKEIEQPKPVTKEDFLPYLQKKSEEVQAKERDRLRAKAREEALRAYDAITKGMVEAASKGQSQYTYIIEDQTIHTSYLGVLKSEFKSWATFKDMNMDYGYIKDAGSSRFLNTTGITFLWGKNGVAPKYPPISLDKIGF